MLRQALRSLYSPAELGQSGLARLLYPGGAAADLASKGKLIRRVLLDAIEMLRPTEQALPSASAFRSYECISLRYVSGLSVDDTGRKLGLSPRQVYRDLRWGENRLVELLNAHLGAEDCAEDRFRSAGLSRELDAFPLSE